MDPSANPYSTDANIFVGAPIQGGQTGQQPRQQQPQETEPADSQSMFAGMQQVDPFAQPTATIAPPVVEDPFHEKPSSDFFGSAPQETSAQPAPAPPAPTLTSQPAAEQQKPESNPYDGFYTGPGTSPSDPTPDLVNVNESPGRDDDDDGDGNKKSDVPIESQTSYVKTGKCWKVAFYQEYFDVDTSDVLDRMKTSLMVMVPPQYMEGRPGDLYGPVWVSTTLWMMLAVFNFLAEQWHKVDTVTVPSPTAEGDTVVPTPAPDTETTFETFTWIIISVAVCYGYVVIAPIIVWLYLKWNDCRSSVLTLVSLYGYSMLPFILCLPLTIFSFKPVKWGAIFVSSVYSLIGILYRLHKLSEGISSSSRITLHAGSFVLHAGITILLFYEILILAN
eukprot:TRINITY_DN20368_c0_g1_i1.p1 TRINITY_DN20368_c0_g1~~TRINITY_DN20368_c0_g1_i1.p1  ORF type:complete len:409 (+),score=57.59 TRINITY_DN20368_c0_g1_i1:57-1229(+)